MNDLDALVAGLRAWTGGHDAHVRAAVELVIWYECWLCRVGFTRECVHQRGREAWIDWDDAREFAECGARASTSAMASLDPTVALGENRYRLSIMGATYSQQIAIAVARAVGVIRCAAEDPRPQAADRWTWIIIACHTKLRRA